MREAKEYAATLEEQLQSTKRKKRQAATTGENNIKKPAPFGDRS